MSRVVLLALAEQTVRKRCLDNDVGVSVVEPLSSGGVRLVCKSGDGAAVIRRELKANLISGDVVRTRIRPLRSSQ